MFKEPVAQELIFNLEASSFSQPTNALCTAAVIDLPACFLNSGLLAGVGGLVGLCETSLVCGC